MTLIWSISGIDSKYVLKLFITGSNFKFAEIFDCLNILYIETISLKQSLSLYIFLLSFNNNGLEYK